MKQHLRGIVRAAIFYLPLRVVLFRIDSHRGVR